VRRMAPPPLACYEVRMNSGGFMAIWSDLRAEDETDYLHWLTREHTQERVGVPGFRTARVFRRITTDVRRYLIVYELDGAGVMAAEPYLARLNAPTDWSRRTMPRLGNFVRGGGRVEAQAGTGWGGFVAAVRLSEVPDDSWRDLVGRLVRHDRIAAARLCVVDRAASGIPTRERAMREEDASFAAVLLVEGLDAEAVSAAVRTEPVVPGPEVPVYSTVFSLIG
jgi:hypothetical protein